MLWKRASFPAAALSAALLLVLPASGVAQEASGPLAQEVAGTWMGAITIPPNPFLGNTADIVIQELVTFLEGGGVIVSPSMPMLPLPKANGEVLIALSSVGHANWERHGPRTVRTTNWRFLTDPQTGQPAGIVKIYAELEYVGPRRMRGRYVFEALNSDLSPMLVGGIALKIGPARFILKRVPVEPMP